MKQSNDKFETRRAKCTDEVRNVLDLLMREAEHAGPHIDRPRYDAKGEGVTYCVGGKPFCRFDPKHRVHHVWAWIAGANPSALDVIGPVPNRKHGPWVRINSMSRAMGLLPEIKHAYERARNG
jgi:hypothetical protein